MIWLLGCQTDDSKPADTYDSGDTAVVVETDALFSAAGASVDGMGNAVAFGEFDGDDEPELVAAAYLGNRVCVLLTWPGPGSFVMDDLDSACQTGELETDYAGYGMGVLPDWYGDGLDALAVGSIGNGEMGVNAGKLHIVAAPLSEGSLGDSAFSLLGETEGDYFGIAVAAGGNLRGDDNVTLMVGASGFDGADGGGGRAYLYAPGESAPWATITGRGADPEAPPHATFGAGDYVGDSLVGDYDFDGDGLADLALGASGDASIGQSSGRVGVWFGPILEGAWSITDADVSIFGEAELTYTGSPTQGTPDLSGDGLADILVSADTLGPGVVYLLSPVTLPTSVLDASARFTGQLEYELFGYAAEPSDIDADGVLDVVVSAPTRGGEANQVGAFDVFYGPHSGTLVADASWGGGSGAEMFGSALATIGSSVAVGDRNRGANGAFSGQLQVFELGSP